MSTTIKLKEDKEKEGGKGEKKLNDEIEEKNWENVY